MVRGLLGKKIGMTQVFDKEGRVIPVTVVEAGPCCILELKSSPVKVTLGFEEAKETRLNKTRLGFFKKNNIKPLRIIREFEAADTKDCQVGQFIKADLFRAGDFVDVTGTSIGKGFQGGMKRWGWVGGPGGHGSMHHRRVGSVCSSTEPSRVFKGRTMPGHMGTDRVTVQSLRVIDVNIEKNLLLIKGAIPGYKRGYVLINLSKKKVFKSLDEKKAAAAVSKNPLKMAKQAAKGKA
ncbi:MAG: 50S ribosomal protein L3 [Candidatus Omnitrophica bacterium]|nr:50S ribosomal protein L3 [Candidatus Omnitrophota bacterium]